MAHKSTTDFAVLLAAAHAHARRVLVTVTARQPASTPLREYAMNGTRVAKPGMDGWRKAW